MKPIEVLGKVVGHIENMDTHPRTYITKRGPEHFFKLYQGFGISAEVLRTCLKYENDVHYIIIIYHGKNGYIRYTTNIMTWLREGTIHYDEGDKQYILSVSFMESDGHKGDVP